MRSFEKAAREWEQHWTEKCSGLKDRPGTWFHEHPARVRVCNCVDPRRDDAPAPFASATLRLDHETNSAGKTKDDYRLEERVKERRRLPQPSEEVCFVCGTTHVRCARCGGWIGGPPALVDKTSRREIELDEYAAMVVGNGPAAHDDAPDSEARRDVSWPPPWSPGLLGEQVPEGGSQGLSPKVLLDNEQTGYCVSDLGKRAPAYDHELVDASDREWVQALPADDEELAAQLADPAKRAQLEEQAQDAMRRARTSA